MIPPSAVRELQDRLSIIDVVGGYVSLKKAGRNFKALCPFHPEKTPSFMIYPEKQFFICYGCGAGGDAITFVMKHEKLEFTEAVEVLAQKAGIELPHVAGGKPAKENAEFIEAHEVAVEFFRRQLGSPEGEAARAYLKKRGLLPETWETFAIGYAPQRWDGLVGAAAKAELTPAALERAGLAIARDGRQGWYDRFRDRVMFPIWDSRGRVIAFGGRVLEGDGPKYMNSPETELYIKGKVLYGLHLAAPEIRQKDFCIVVEGYMDMVMPFQHGFRNVVASMGTSLTEQQVKLIRRYTRNVVIVYDGDSAGQTATLRGLDLCLEAEMRVRLAVLPGGADPDSLIREQGAERFARVLKESQELFDYKLGMLTRKFDGSSLEGKVAVSQEMLTTISRVPNAVQRGEYVRRLAEALKVSEHLLWADLGRVKRGFPLKPEEPQKAAKAPEPVRMRAEEELAGLLLEDPGLAERVAGRLDLEELHDPEVRSIVERLMGSADIRDVIEAIPRGSPLQSRMMQWRGWVDSVSVTEKARMLEKTLDKIREDHYKVSKEKLIASLKRASEAGEKGEENRLLFELDQLNKNRNVPKQAVQ